ncbi:hypothetical protein HBI12_186040 [Parastagonospora nodorum]|nr:hypothetical protein HBI12_186040 [Parastagonospora nodorum]KAH6080699.1 hypothetical protein HBI66_068600 [Parastagonospora nodorum]
MLRRIELDSTLNQDHGPPCSTLKHGNFLIDICHAFGDMIQFPYSIMHRNLTELHMRHRRLPSSDAGIRYEVIDSLLQHFQDLKTV